MSSNPIVSVILVCWNSAAYLPRCLASLSAQTYHNLEVILLDNGSTDDAMQDLQEKYPRLNLRVERLGSNLGFAAANNLGAQLAQGQWLALLNPDAFPASDWLEQLLKAAEAQPAAFFASRQIQADQPDLLDGEGDVYHVSGLAWRRNYGLPVYSMETPQEVFSACAAAALYSRSAFLTAGGFDEDYFAYHEDVDLGFRLRLHGLRCLFVPQAVVHHVGSASHGKESDFAIYHGHRNLTWTYIKDMPGFLMWLFLPLHIVTSLISLARFSFTGHASAIWRAKMDAVRGSGAMLRKRRQVQGERRVSVIEIYRQMNGDLLAPMRTAVARRRTQLGKV
jgi:GT2 family glycosyltransferase